MTSAMGSLVRAVRMICLTGALGILFGSSAMAGVVEVFHADSLAGPMSQLKKAFETKNPTVTINLTASTSRQLADRILKGDTCDVFAPSMAKNPKEATEFVRFILSADGQKILLDTGQPPVVPALRFGDVPADLKN